MLLLSETLVSTVAAPERETVHHVDAPGRMDAGEQRTEESTTAGAAGCRTIGTVLVTVPSTALKVAACVAVMVVATAENDAVVVPAGTVTELKDNGNCAEEVASRTMVFVVGALVMVTVHVVVCWAVRLVGVQTRLLRAGAAGAPNANVVVRTTPAELAVTVAEAAAVIVPAVMVKLVDDEPAGTVTEAGTGTRSEFEASETTTGDAVTPPSVTWQVDFSRDVSVVGVQEILLKRGTGGGAVAPTVTVPPVAVTLTALPAAETPAASVTVKGMVVAVEAKVMRTVAATPLAMAVAFIPLATHR